MTTSGIYSFSVSRDDIIRQALLNIGKLDGFEDPSPDVTRDCARVLNMLCKQWMGRGDYAPGLKVWTRKRGHLFLSTTTNRYVLGPASTTGWTESYLTTTVVTAAVSGASTFVIDDTGVSIGQRIGVELSTGALQWTTISGISIASGNATITIPTQLTEDVDVEAQVYVYTTVAQQPVVVESAVLRDIDNNDTPLRIMLTTQDYDMLPSKANTEFTGDPTSIYVEHQLDNSYLYTDVATAQDVTKHIVLTYMQPVQDFVNPTDTPYYPQEYYLALCWGLAKEIAPMFQATWTDLMEDNFKSARAIAQHKEPAQSTLYFQPGADE